MIIGTLVNFTRSAPIVWKLGQENHGGGRFSSQDFDALLWMRSVDFVLSLRRREK